MEASTAIGMLYQLVGGLGSLGPYGLTDDMGGRLEELNELIWPTRPDGLIDDPDDEAVLRWFCDWLPRCMELVPPKRRQAFLSGVYQRTREEDNPVAF